MIQVLKAPERQLSTKDRFANAFANLGLGAAQYLPEFVEERKKKNALSANEKRASEITGMDLTGLSQEQIGEALKGHYGIQKIEKQEQLRSQGKENLFDKKADAIKKLFSGENPQNNMQDVQQSEHGLPDMSDENLLSLTALDPNLARTASHIQEMKNKEKSEDRREIRESFKDHKDYIDKTLNDYESSLRKDAILGRMSELESSGDLTEQSLYNLFDSIGFKPEWLQNPANEEYNKLTLDLLGGGTLQSDYGTRLLASEFKVSQQRIPQLIQTPEGRKQIGENLKVMMLPTILKAKRLEYYLDKSDREGKPLPNNLRGKIQSDIKPELEEVYEKFKQRNGRYKVKKGTSPQENEIEKYYYLSDANEDKAIKMMEEDGYNVY